MSGWLSAHRTPHRLSALQLGMGILGTASIHPERREPREGCHKHWDHLTFSIQECVFRSSDADLGWLWAPPMNLSCMAIKIKANKERFGWKMPDLELSPRRVHQSITDQSTVWPREPGHYNPFSGPWSNLISLHPFRSGRRVSDQAERY